MSIKRLENVGAPQGRGRWGEKFAFPRERQQTRENATVCANNARRSLVEDEKPRIDPPSSRSLFPPFPPLFFPEEAVVFPDKREHMNDLSGRSKVVQQISSGESTPPSIYPPRGQERGLVATRTSKMAGERERERERVVQAFSNL